MQELLSGAFLFKNVICVINGRTWPWLSCIVLCYINQHLDFTDLVEPLNSQNDLYLMHSCISDLKGCCLSKLYYLTLNLS